MPRKIFQPNFNRLGFENDDNLEFNPELDDNLQQAVIRLLGWNYIKEEWDMVSLDSDGRLLVSTSPTKAQNNNSSNATVTNSASNVLVENLDRKAALIQNTGTNRVYLGFGEDATTSQGFLLIPDALYILDVWLGRVSAITASGTSTLNIQEMSS